MRKYLTPIYVVLFLIAATALWYFGHHRPAEKILETEPKRVYKSTPLQPKSLPVPLTLSDSTQGINEGDTDVEVEAMNTESENMDNAATSEKIDNSQERNADSDSDVFMSQEALSAEEAAALKAYEEAQSEYLAVQDILQAALDARPIDWERISSANNDFKNAARRRKEALQNLAPYSEAAVKLLERMEEAERQSEEIMAGYKAKSREYEAEIREMRELLEKLRPEKAMIHQKYPLPISVLI